MIDLSDNVIPKAHEIVGKSPARAAGYRVKILPLSSDTGLKAGEKEKYPTLAALGVQISSEREAERETKGSEMGIVVDIGPCAFRDERLGGDPWVREGQVVKYLRYAGHEFQDPPGSGVVYRLINDEDILGYYEDCIS